jgi:hypothetical protein
VNGSAQLVATLEGDNVKFLATDDVPPVAVWQPVTALDDAAWNLPLLFATCAIFACALIAWPVAALVRRHKGVALAMTRRQKYRRLATRVVIFASGLSLAGWILFLLRSSTDLALLSDASDGFLRLLQMLAIVAVLGLALVVWNYIELLRRRDVGAWPKIGHGMITFACAASVWFIVWFDLTRAQLDY